MPSSDEDSSREPRHQWSREFAGSIPEAIATAEWIEDIADRLNLTAKVRYALQLCTEELVTNIIRHGGNPEPHIKVMMGEFDTRVELVIEDDCRPFDVAAARPHSIDQPLEAVEPGGLGLQLVHHFASRLRHERTLSGNRVTVSILLTGNSGAEARSDDAAPLATNRAGDRSAAGAARWRFRVRRQHRRSSKF
jgi:serine/threonine-protein kinase RsbW